MSDQPLWVEITQWSVWGIVFGLTMGWLKRAREAGAAGGKRKVLCYPRATQIVSAVCAVGMGGLALGAGLYARPDEAWAFWMLSGFTLMNTAWLADTLRVRHELTEEGIVYRGLLHHYGCVPWAELVSARHRFAPGWLAITVADGRKLRFSNFLRGQEALALALAERAPHLQMDPATSKMLALARQGVLPGASS